MAFIRSERDQLPSIKLTSDEMKCCITYVESPSRIALNILDEENMNHFDEYMDNISKEYSLNGQRYAVKSKNNLKFDLPVIYKKENSWLRGKILHENESQKLKIENLDDGMADIVPIENIYFMKKGEHHPTQCIWCKLYAVMPKGRKWTINAVNIMEKKVRKEMTVLFTDLHPTDGVYAIYIKDCENSSFSFERQLLLAGEAILIGEHMVRSGYRQAPTKQFIRSSVGKKPVLVELEKEGETMDIDLDLPPPSEFADVGDQNKAVHSEETEMLPVVLVKKEPKFEPIEECGSPVYVNPSPFFPSSFGLTALRPPPVDLNQLWYLNQMNNMSSMRPPMYSTMAPQMAYPNLPSQMAYPAFPPQVRMSRFQMYMNHMFHGNYPS